MRKSIRLEYSEWSEVLASMDEAIFGANLGQDKGMLKELQNKIAKQMKE